MNGVAPGAAPGGGRPAGLDAVFRPVRARRVAVAVAATQFGVLALLAVALPREGAGAFQWYDRIGVLLFGGIVAWLLSRFARIDAVPGLDGLRVRNLFLTRALTWPEVTGVRFGDGDPWVTLDLADGDTVPVMAVQRADGEPARAEARRLATLVALQGRRGPGTSAPTDGP